MGRIGLLRSFRLAGKKIFVGMQPVERKMLLQGGQGIESGKALVLKRCGSPHSRMTYLPEDECLHHGEQKDQKHHQEDIAEGGGDSMDPMLAARIRCQI